MSKWFLLFIPIQIYIISFITLKEFKRFSEQPSFKTGWFLFVILSLVVVIVIMAFRRKEASHIISIDDNVLRFQRILGDKSWTAEAITTVIENSGSYRLYSDDNEISISKKLIPEDLDQYLHSCTSKTKLENKAQ